MPSHRSPCTHPTLLTTPSSHATHAGYKSFTAQQLFTAATGSRRRSRSASLTSLLYPAPLVLPEDELARDPKYPPQSFKSWLNDKERNKVTDERKTVYVAAPPLLGQNIPNCIRYFTNPQDQTLTQRKGFIAPPDVEDVMAYLSAFFHGLPIKQLPDQLEWTSDLEGRICNPTCQHKSAKAARPNVLRLRSMKAKTTTQVKVRHLDPKDALSAYRSQLNLNDILDHAIEILPKDAYCLLQLIDHDLYEDDDDDFCCGRAYGGSRICVVSSAQYSPALDAWHGIDATEGHWWPGSHCANFVEAFCGGRTSATTSKKRKIVAPKEVCADDERHKREGRSASNAIMIDSSMLDSEADTIRESPLQEAVAVQNACLEKIALSETDLRSLYLRRLTLTASHELLHCFGLDHCVYYACAMQATSSVVEDIRQPPYLCPVCESKLARSVLNVSIEKEQARISSLTWWKEKYIIDWRKERHQAIIAFSEARGIDDLGFVSLGAWTKRLLTFGTELELLMG